MTISTNGINLIKSFEGLRLNAYLDTGGVPTIGYGSTMWSDGKKVQMGQAITMDDAQKLLLWEVNNKTTVLNSLLASVNLNQNQFDSLVSFSYNVGVGAFASSTMLKKIKVNPNDPTITNEFMKWVNVNHKPNNGLKIRRTQEAALYFK